VELKDKIDELGRTIESFKAENDRRLKEIEKKGGADPLLQEKVDKNNEAISKLMDEIKSVQTAMNRMPADIEAKMGLKKGEDAPEVKAAFQKYLRKSEKAMTADEFKALSVDSNPDGGFLVRPELSATIVKKIFETSPMRMLADQESIGTDSLDILVDIDEASAGWVAERGARPSTGTPQVKNAKIFPQELYAMPQATQKQLDDAIWDIEKWLSEKVSDKLARLANTAFVSGTGVGQPRGFTTYPSGTTYGKLEQIGSGSSGVVTADGLMALLYGLKEPYQANATFVMQRATMLKVRQLKDSQNRYLFEPSLQKSGVGELLLGRDVQWFSDMPAVGAGALAIGCGDFKRGYKIVDNPGIRVLRDPFTSKPNVLFYTTMRVGGDVMDFEAIKLQVLT
jgi:HK97 family phage major capsid protein